MGEERSGVRQPTLQRPNITARRGLEGVVRASRLPVPNAIGARAAARCGRCVKIRLRFFLCFFLEIKQ